MDGGRGNGRSSESRNVPQAIHSGKSEKMYGLITKKDRYTYMYAYMYQCVIQNVSLQACMGENVLQNPLC